MQLASEVAIAWELHTVRHISMIALLPLHLGFREVVMF